MLRAILATVLIAIVAWPHALCFCHSLHAASHNAVYSQREPAPTHDSDDEDDDDGCTCCKLRQVLADPVVPMLHQTEMDFVGLLPIDTFTSAARPVRDGS